MSNDEEVPLTESLIDLSNIPEGQISGLDTETLNWVTEQSSERFISELSDGFLNFLNEEETSERVDEEILNELDELEKENTPRSSLQQTTANISRFRTFLTEKNLSSDIDKVPPAILDTYLRYFYSSLRTKDGKLYAPKTLICIRAAIHRYFQINRPNVNIIEDRSFCQSNRMLKTMVAKFKKSGQEVSKERYPVIQKKDMEKIRLYFDRSTPMKLQEEIIFNLLYYFGLRGRETLPHLTKDSFSLETSSTGKVFLTIQHEILSKNAKASLRTKDFNDIKTYRMYEYPEKSEECPIVAWKLYIEMISDSPYLFPKPSAMQIHRRKKNFCEKQPLGKHSIDNLMSNLSRKIDLSRMYTNHCIRVTMITGLKEHGFSNAEISDISGHKNPHSVDRYFRRRKDEDLENMADSLHLESSASASLVHVQKISSKARILTMSSEMCASTSGIIHEAGINKPIQPVINFNGRFYNCSFNIHK